VDLGRLILAGIIT